jgi:hypothetical protein
MAIEDVLELVAPFVTPNPRDQALDRMNCRHWHRTQDVKAQRSAEIREENQRSLSHSPILLDH